jgi:hypothetical protein
MPKPKLTRSRIALALAIAAAADMIQIPITVATATGALAAPAELFDLVVDCTVMGIMSALLGFHWLFLPSLVFEIVPGIDLLPTWTGCVAFVVWRRKKTQQTHVIDVEAEVIAPPPLLSRTPVPALEEISPEQNTNQN